MAHQQVVLDVAEFLDSPAAVALEAPARRDVRKIAELFLAACYDELGTKPHLLQGEDMHAIVGHVLPGKLARKDPLAEHVPAVLRAYLDHLETAHVVSQSYELRQALEHTTPELLEAVRTGQAVHHGAHERQAPVVHKAPKLGRNDPCFCGSGRKFKKCCGKAG